jgi:dihydropyrimidinase
MYNCVIADGTLITAAGLQQADLGILDGTIAEIGDNLSGRERIDAAGLLVIPGGVDPHVHLGMPAGRFTTSDSWETGSRAAALGGTTTVIDFVEPYYPGQPLLDALATRQGEAAGSAIDYSLHMTLCAADAATLAAIPAVIRAGLTSFKLYTTYEGFCLGDEALLWALEAVGKAGGLAMVHAESDPILRFAAQRLTAAGRVGLDAFADSRPAIAEVEAVQRVLTLALCAGAPLYLAHLSTSTAAALLTAARQKGQAAWGETCPQYLLLGRERLDSPDLSGAKFTCCPPLRSAADRESLWAALGAEEIQAISSDHCAFTFAGQKDSTGGAFAGIPSGLPGVELRLALAYTYGVAAGRITPQQWVEQCCTAPARLFGLGGRKGALRVGADADIVLFDPRRKTTVTRAILHENVDYTPYEGLALSGMVDTTLLRGQALVRGGQWLGFPGSGQFIPGQPISARPWEALPR